MNKDDEKLRAVVRAEFEAVLAMDPAIAPKLREVLPTDAYVPRVSFEIDRECGCVLGWAIAASTPDFASRLERSRMSWTAVVDFHDWLALQMGRFRKAVIQPGDPVLVRQVPEHWMCALEHAILGNDPMNELHIDAATLLAWIAEWEAARARTGGEG